MPEFSTPLQHTPVRASYSTVRSPAIAEEDINRPDFRSPQVLFDQGTEKHARATPASGRGLSKKLRSRIGERTPKLLHANASPSIIHARSMLSFDLHGGIPVLEDQIPGESDLFVKFVKNRRRSDGRGSLRELINKRIALQTTGQVLALRKANQAAPPEQKTEQPPPSDSSRDKPHQKKATKTVRFREQTVASDRASSSSRIAGLEIPLGQDGEAGLDLSSQQTSVTQPLLTQTQPLSPTQPLSQTQPISPTRPLSQTQVWMGTQEPQPISPETSSEPSSSSSASSPSFSERPRRRERTKNVFVDDEASEDSEDGARASGDESDGSDESDLSDLVASTPEESDNDSQGHAKLHLQWRQAMEDKYDPFAPKGVSSKELDDTSAHKSRKERLLQAAKFETASPIKTTAVSKKKVVEAKVPKQPELVPAWKLVTRKKAGPKRNPHRRSSVSSVDRFDITNSISSLTRQIDAVHFSFISAPSKAALESIDKRHELKTIAEEAAAAPQRLMGSKRFVFGN